MNKEEHIENALESIKPGENLYNLALDLKNSGLNKEELYYLFDSFRKKHKNDGNEIKYNAILDTIDFIVGHCAPDKQIYKP